MEFLDLRPKEIQGVVKYTPNTKRWTAKNRKNHIVGIQLCGSAKHTFSGFEFVISRNCVYFLNQKDDYTVELLDDTQAFSIHFTTEEFVETDSFCFPVSDPAKFHSLLQTAETAYRSDKHHLLYSALHQICAEIQRISQKTYAKQDERILSAKAYMDMHFGQKDCLHEAVSRAGITQRRFCDLFFQTFDVTPNRYIQRRRIEQGKVLLSTGGLSVSDVAEACGFSDVYYFNKVFKKETGITPGKWK